MTSKLHWLRKPNPICLYTRCSVHLHAQRILDPASHRYAPSSERYSQTRYLDFLLQLGTISLSQHLQALKLTTPFWKGFPGRNNKHRMRLACCKCHKTQIWAKTYYNLSAVSLLNPNDRTILPLQLPDIFCKWWCTAETWDHPPLKYLLSNPCSTPATYRPVAFYILTRTSKNNNPGNATRLSRCLKKPLAAFLFPFSLLCLFFVSTPSIPPAQLLIMFCGKPLLEPNQSTFFSFFP